VPGGSPLAVADVVRGVPGGVQVAGWAVDPDTASPIEIHAYVDGTGTPFTADVPRPDVGGAFPGYGDRHGFSRTISTGPGSHQVCLYAIDVGVGDNVSLGCRDVVVPGGLPFGSIDTAEGKPAGFLPEGLSGGYVIEGWAIDPEIAGPITVIVHVDDHLNRVVAADTPRPDVAAAFPDYGPNHGFIAYNALDPGTYELCVQTHSGAGLHYNFIGCRQIVVPAE
jgi:hypothetical protein